MWPDNETTDDLIGFRVHADLIRATVTNERMLPLTIGVFGDWGSGKTSIVKMLLEDLSPERWEAGSEERKQCENTAVVLLNPWLFEGYDDAKAAILEALLLELAAHKRIGPRLLEKAKDVFLGLFKTVSWMRVAKLATRHAVIPAATAVATGGLAAIPAAVATAAAGATIDWNELLDKPEPKDEAIDVRTFRERFGRMLNQSDIATLVVLIDDLDRCSPERIIEILEAIKLFVNVDRTAFVIGADPRIVQHAIRIRYAEKATDAPDKDAADRLIKDYLEKLIQVPYRLPRLSVSEIETYMTLLFCEHYLSADDFTYCLKGCRDGRAANRYASFGFAAVDNALRGRDLPNGLATALGLCAAAAPLIADGLKGNPRQVKRFLNALLLRKKLAQVAGLTSIQDAVLVKLMILEYAYETQFTRLFEWQAQQAGFPREIAELERVLCPPDGNVGDEAAARSIDTQWTTTSLRRWIAMEPRLHTIDLRDYFWIARDRLESTFSGVAMVSPVVRQLMMDLLSDVSAKRSSAVAGTRGLGEDERASVLAYLGTTIQRTPGEKAGYRALIELSEKGTVGAVAALAKSLGSSPPPVMPPAIGMDLMSLIKSHPETSLALQPVATKLSTSDSRIGVAIKKAMV